MIVMRKELIDHFRDRRSLVMGLLYPLLGPLLLASSLYVAGNVTGPKRQSEAINIPTIGVEHAPQFVAYMAKNDINLVPPEGDLASYVKAGNAPLGFEIPPEAAVNDQFRLKVYADFSKIDNLRASSYVSRIIGRFNRAQAVSLAEQAGIREDFMITVAIDQVNLSRPATWRCFSTISCRLWSCS